MPYWTQHTLYIERHWKALYLTVENVNWKPNTYVCKIIWFSPILIFISIVTVCYHSTCEIINDFILSNGNKLGLARLALCPKYIRYIVQRLIMSLEAYKSQVNTALLHEFRELWQLFSCWALYRTLLETLFIARVSYWTLFHTVLETLFIACVSYWALFLTLLETLFIASLWVGATRVSEKYELCNTLFAIVE